MNTLTQLQQIRQNLPSQCKENVELREQMLVEARGLLLDLERPDNAVERLCYPLIESSAVYTAIKMGLFRTLKQQEKAAVDDIAKSCNADPILTGRLLRCLAAHGAVREHGSSSYGPTTVSGTFTEDKNIAAMELCFDFLSRAWLAMPSFLEERGWQNPTSKTDTCLAKGFNRPDKPGFWHIIKDHPAQKAFNVYMASYNEGHQKWTEYYPVLERLGKDVDNDPLSALMVDVGGGFGHQALSFRREFPQLPGRVIVQDLPQGLPKERNPEIEYMEHDFTREQPIKGARFYYLRYVIHDYSQEPCIHLCTQLRNAMKPGYSKLIVHEWIVPDTNAPRFMTSADLNMMSAGAGMERTLALHQEYLEKAGLKITKIYSAGDRISESVIEAEVA